MPATNPRRRVRSSTQDSFSPDIEGWSVPPEEGRAERFRRRTRFRENQREHSAATTAACQLDGRL